jgi:polyhydroxyalkanoate synthesis repressor PhaR
MISAQTAGDERMGSLESDAVQIKRYPNRRFYDRARRRYVTLQDIEELVRRGHTIDVRDSRNDEDLTRLVLTQILLERHPERMEMFPIALLHLLLRANDLALEFLRVFFRLSLATTESLLGSRALTPFPSPFGWMRMSFPEPSPGPRTPDESAEATIEQLSWRVAELEGRVKQLESGSLPHHVRAPSPLTGGGTLAV